MVYSTATGWDLDVLRRQLDDLLETLTAHSRGPSAGWAPPVDVIETCESFVVRVDIPGVPAAEVRLSVRDRELRIVGNRRSHRAPAGERHYTRMERGAGRFALTVALPGPIDPSHSSATLRSGVLEVRLARVEERRHRVHTIPVAHEEP